ncbi:hypothetical protein EX30DRAFT_337541 [Ascodesmis nigricans]|uniref:Uncharacterized protein n=1 Tax=Ascodesmis nigricans TaxID=341454 RepID=A0A4S2N760_9PEZI|nr:hypothetical protein EX30DRAFT_337541 [Ascodesmis nigricans]
MQPIVTRRQIREFYILPLLGHALEQSLERYTSFGPRSGPAHWMALLIALPIGISIYNRFATMARGTPLAFLSYT